MHDEGFYVDVKRCSQKQLLNFQMEKYRLKSW
jgi:hypothetical protein